MILILSLWASTGGWAQTLPTPIEGSGAFATRPLVPAQGEMTRLTLSGELPAANGAVALTQVDIAPELVTVDLETSWLAGGPAGSTPEPWAIAVELGDLAPGTYDLWVRVNGATFLLTYFRVEPAWPAPAPLPALAPTVDPQRPLGINLAYMKDWSQALIFVDAFKASRPWLSQRDGGAVWDSGEALDLDDLGWVRSLLPGQEAGTVMLTGLGAAYPGGRWTVLYEGEGELHFDWDARVIDAEPGRMELYVTPEIGIHASIRSTNPDNYIRNIRVIMPGFEETYQTQPFHPTYVDFLRQFSVLRFMDWGETNSPLINAAGGEWSQRTTPDHATQASERGVALEYIVGLANAVGADPWINIPVTATDEYVTEAARLFDAGLAAERRVFIEHSNEVWNGFDFPQNAHAVAQGMALGLAADEFTAGLRWHSQRSLEIFALFEQVFGSTARLVRVLGGWLPDSLDYAQSIATEIVDWQDAHLHADAYAVGPYFGYFLATPDYAQQVIDMPLPQLLDTYESEMRDILDVGRGMQQFIAARGLELVTYEAGMTPAITEQSAVNDSPHQLKLTAASRHPRMGEIYDEFLAGWHEFGGHMNLYNDIQGWRSWGLVHRWDEGAAAAPKYRAVQDFLGVAAPVVAPPVVAPVPVAGSGAFATRPLVPAQGELTRLTLSGDFAYSNAEIALTAQQVAPELITIDLTTVWAIGSDGPADATATPWTVDVELGDLPQGVYDVLVRVNGAQFFFSYFAVEPAWAAPAPLPAATPAVDPQRPLGINLAGAKYFSSMMVFVDAFKASQPWLSQRDGGAVWDSGEALDLDDLGWVRSLLPGQEAGTVMLTGLGAAYPGGRWTVLYEGEGELHFDWDARVIDAEPGRMELYVTPEAGIHASIRGTNPDNYIRNIRVIMPGFEETYQEQPFHPTYVDFLRQFSTLRFADWTEVNSAETNTAGGGEWAQRITPDHASQGSFRGVALEYIVDLANAVGADAWINVPATATDAYATQMAALIRDRLDPAARLYLEYANEPWNGMFPQHDYVVAQGLGLGLADDGFTAGLRYQAQRSLEVFAPFEQAFGGNGRLVRVMGGWSDADRATSEWVADQLLGWQDAHSRVDFYAVAPYFGWRLAQPDLAAAVAAMAVDALLDTVAAEMRHMLDIGRRVRVAAAAYDVELIAYEGGHHLLSAHGDPYPNEAVRQRLTAVHDHPRMYDIYAEYLAGWFSFSGHMNLFNDIHRFSPFGLLRHWDQAVATSPRYQATRDFLLTAPTPLVALPPAPTAASGALATRPLVPAAGESNSLHLSGEFAFANAAIALVGHQVEGDQVAVDLVTQWTGGTDAPGEAAVTPWGVVVALGDLAAGGYDVTVRVNDLPFFYGYFAVEPAWPAPTPLPQTAAPVQAQRALAVNLAPVKAWSRALVFVDAFKASQPWLSQRDGGAVWDSGEALDLDDLGWVRSLLPGQEAGTVMLTGLGAAYPGGRWTVLYEGEGELHFDWDARVIDAEPGRMELYVTPEIGIHASIRGTNPDNYIRNIRVIMPGFEETYQQQPFHPTYVDFLRQFSTLRFMEWGEINQAPAGQWGQRVSADYATQASQRGVALEYMVALANAAGADAWLNMPHAATDEYVTEAARLFYDGLAAGLRLHVEHSSELWNGFYPQHHYASERGLALGLSDDAFIAALRYHSQRSLEIFALCGQVFGAGGGLVRVMGGWLLDEAGANDWASAELLDWQGAAAQTDVYAVASHFSADAGLPVGAMLDAATTAMRQSLDLSGQLAAALAQRGIELAAYSAGQRLEGAAATGDPRMYDIYAEYLDGWSQFGGALALYGDIRSESGAVLPRWDQALADAPTYRAVRDFLAAPAAAAKPSEAAAVGFVHFDFDPAAGDQRQQSLTGAEPGDVLTLELQAAALPEIAGWNVVVEYDPGQLRYVDNSFVPSDWIPGLVVLVAADDGSVSVGGTRLAGDAAASGAGALGSLSFEVLDGLGERTELAIVENGLRRTDDRIEQLAVRSLAVVERGTAVEEVVLRGDGDGDGDVDFADFFELADAFGGSDPRFDFDGDGQVGFADFFLFADHFGQEGRAKLLDLAQRHLGLPAAPGLEPNYPNPFNSATVIPYKLAAGGAVRLDIYDALGQKVRSLTREHAFGGVYELAWDGTDGQGRSVASGLYFYRLQAGPFGAVRKMTLIK